MRRQGGIFGNDVVGLSGVWTLIEAAEREAEGSWAFPSYFTARFIVIGGGGGASTGGGGAGGYVSSVTGSNSGGNTPALSASSFGENALYTVSIGAGGAGGSTGSPTSIKGYDIDLTALGGGAGKGDESVGGSGGSGGGAGASNAGGLSGGFPAAGQGFNGGAGGSTSGMPWYCFAGSQRPECTRYGGGGGGAGGAGINANTGTGGAGITSSVTGSAVARASGGAGGPNSSASGTANTGNGGSNGANGGSGIIIVEHSTLYTPTNPSGGVTFSYSTNGSTGNRVTLITAGTGTMRWVK